MNTETDIIITNKKVSIICNQTNISEEEALQLLKKNNYNEIEVIKLYLGIPKKKPLKINSVNQEIYKQIRERMGQVTKEYRNNNPVNLNHVRENFRTYDN
jgi:hypothetical protein